MTLPLQYALYNAALRAQSESRSDCPSYDASVMESEHKIDRRNDSISLSHHSAFRDSKKAGKLFSTTISVLASAVQKICRVEKLPEGLRLYRGLGGKQMDFSTADVQGRKGFVELGFMSTTSEMKVRQMVFG